jgi:hypothetical protein
MGGRQKGSTGSEQRIRALIQGQLAPNEVLLEGVRFSDPRHGDVEVDFLILIPGAGIAVIEVKGGDITLTQGQWRTKYGNVTRRINPIEQARRAKHAMRRYLDRQPEWSHGLIRSEWFVVLPFTEISGDMSTEARRELLVGKSDLDQLLPHVRRTLGSTLNNDPQPNAEDIDLALSLLLRKKDADAIDIQTGKTLLQRPIAWIVAAAAITLSSFAYISYAGQTTDSPASEPKLAPANSSCDPNYDPCIPISDDLTCGDIRIAVRVIGTDIHGFDRDGDLVGCEIYQ